jgi:hypothetical protein
LFPGPWFYEHASIENGLNAVERRLMDKRLELQQ